MNITNSPNNNGYLALARKYRPQIFADMIGQQPIINYFTNAFKLGRIHHGFIFTGIRGVGKTTTARIVAKALNCSNNQQASIEICNKCDNCLAINQDNHPDVMEMDAASRTGIEDIKEVIEFTKYLPVKARYKVIIIDEIHMLSTKAFNALLKTLEEPASRIIFIFATTEIKKVPVTIISRCQRFDLQRLTIDEIAKYLIHICQLEQVQFEQDALKIIAEISEGSVRDALSILDQVINLSLLNDKVEIVVEQVNHLIGRCDYHFIISMLLAILDGKVEESLNISRQINNNIDSPLRVIELLINLTHYLIVSKHSDYQVSFLNEKQKKMLQEYNEKLSIPILSRLWNMLLKAIEELKLCPQSFMALEVIIIKICHVKYYPTPIDLLGEGNLDIETKASKADASVREVTQDQKVEIKNFEELIEILKQNHQYVLAFNLANHANLIEFSTAERSIKMNINDNFNKDEIIKLKIWLKEYNGENWHIITSLEQKGEISVSEQRKIELNNKLAEIKNEPMIKKLHNHFPNAEIIDIIEHK